MNILKLNSKGPDVQLLQSTLQKIGFYKSIIDGLYGYNTYNSVLKFQKEFGLSQDGIVGENTWNALFPYLNGYTNYTIKDNDTIYSIAKFYQTTVDAILFANPDIDYNNLQIGQKIIVPFSNIVPTNISYTSNILEMNINSLLKVYPFLNLSYIGISVLNNPIPVIRFGNGKKEVLYVASTHANEWITSVLLMKFLENLSKSYVNNLKIFNEHARTLFDNVSLYIIPMLNPDGVNLVTGYYNEYSTQYTQAKNISENYPDITFPDGWKANIEGIDLNLQFPAGWAEAKKIKYELGFDKPAPRDFVGYGPLTAPESVAIYNFILSKNFDLMLTYHTQGRIIYYKYQEQVPSNSLKLATEFSKLSGYEINDVPQESSYAGLKDWFIDYYDKPGFTIEAGIGINPLPISQFLSIYKDNIGILISGLTK